MNDSSGSESTTPEGRLPPSRWPVWYFGFAHLSLALAGAYLAARPYTFVGAFYHPEAMVPVHLVTLGWISASILGALYLIAPMALRVRLPPSKLDGWAFWFYVLGVAGMVSHFWLSEYSGMVWSALMVLLAVVAVAWRILPRLLRAPVSPAVKTAITLAFAFFVLAFLLGATAGLGKLGIDLPGHQLPTVWSHAHLAALGWATLMVMGAGYRLLPMLLPAAMPEGRAPLAAVLVFAVGTLGLSTGLFLAHRAILVAGALVTVLGLLLFFGQVRWMLKNPRPPARGLPRPRLPLAHLVQAFFYLAAALGLGFYLAVGDPGPLLSSRLVPVYAACGLVGFLAQMVAGVASRLWPLYAWQRDFAAGGFDTPPPSPHSRVDLRYRFAVLGGWTLGVPLLLLGLGLQHPLATGGAGLLLLFAATVDGVDGARILRRRNNDDHLQH